MRTLFAILIWIIILCAVIAGFPWSVIALLGIAIYKYESARVPHSND